jgi:alkanesulfonate monooxygenase SsuD/methylene tetrahydromethanopterin reductase-like flavin-dependent oxidoreductase (luciferase family)
MTAPHPLADPTGTGTASPRVGCVFRPQFPPEKLAAAARAADAAGLSELWLWEDCFATGGISAAAIALANSTHMAVGVGVLPAPMRNVALTAMEIATLERAYPGRVRIGLGHGVQDWMAQIGAKVGSPMTYLREYLTCLAGLLRGDTITFNGRYVSLSNVCLEWPPNPNTELLVGATGPKTLQLSGELASGTVITGGTTPDALREALHHIDTGRRQRTTAAPHSVVVYIVCTTGPAAAAAAIAELKHWDLDPARHITASGTAADIAHAARRWIDAGADTVVLQPTADTDIETFATFVGTEVQPLLNR